MNPCSLTNKTFIFFAASVSFASNSLQKETASSTAKGFRNPRLATSICGYKLSKMLDNSNFRFMVDISILMGIINQQHRWGDHPSRSYCCSSWIQLLSRWEHIYPLVNVASWEIPRKNEVLMGKSVHHIYIYDYEWLISTATFDYQTATAKSYQTTMEWKEHIRWDIPRCCTHQPMELRFMFQTEDPKLPCQWEKMDFLENH